MKSSTVSKKRRPNEDPPQHDYCGTCSEALTRVKFPLNSHPHLSNSVISCSNFKKKCCKHPSSPHHHLGCVSRTIPIDSVVYSSIIQYSELQYSEDQFRKTTTITEPEINLSSMESITSHGSHRSVSTSINSGRRNKSKIENPFLCDYCNVQGSAQYLIEYFSNFRKVKTQYFDDNEAVDSIPPVVNVDDSNSENVITKGLAIENGFITHIMNQYQHDSLKKQSEVTLENIRRIHENVSSGSSSFPSGHYVVTSNYLLGQPLQLYCNITRSYHCGRIIDSRIIDSSFHQRLKAQSKTTMNARSDYISQDSIKDYMTLDKNIGCTQYLVRFRAGLDGRKIATHQWLFLEEHPIMVGVVTVWAKTPTSIPVPVFQDSDGVSKKRNDPNEKHHKMTSIFSPAKIFVRTAIERYRLSEPESVTDSNVEVFAAFYDREDKHVYLKLADKMKSDVGTEMLGASANSEQLSKETILYDSFDEIVAAHWNEPPVKVKLYLQTMRARDETLVENIAAAMVDEEEKQRIIEDHALM